MNRLLQADEKYMERAIELARMGMGRVAPNPMVGCVIVLNDKIIGEGYHRKYGEAHAEVNAVNSVKEGSLLKMSTLYVNLEPCSHHGKTPPCTDMIIRENIKHIVVGAVDPFNGTSGAGIARLKEVGCTVEYGVLNKECVDLNRRFFTFHNRKRPYVILKWAQTADGFIDIERGLNECGQPTWITNRFSRIAVHKMRVDESAILVGTNTVFKDNPSLTAREWYGNSPLRVVIDRSMRLHRDLAIFDGSTKTIVFTSREEEDDPQRQLEYVKTDFDGGETAHILSELYKRDIQSLIVEGGRAMIESFVKNGLWDEARIFTSNKVFGKGVAAPTIHGHIKSSSSYNDCKAIVLENL